MAVACQAVALQQVPQAASESAAADADERSADHGTQVATSTGAAPRSRHPAVTASHAVARLIATHDGARSLAAHALALRAGIIEGGGDPVLARIPGGSAQPAPPGLWQAFFENAMVALGRLRSPSPAALYYNPLLDAAVLTFWERANGGWRVATVRAVPGEGLTGGHDAVPHRPSWVSAEDSPIETLSGISADRLAAFYGAHPPEAKSGARVTTTFAADAADARAVWPRLAWNAHERARWASGTPAWLRPTLSRITSTLSSGDAKAVTAAAPETDPETAEAVAGLPAGLAERLVLDMVLGTGEDGLLLIGSLPDDGEMYFLVLCRLDGTACPLRRVIFVSLLDGAEALGKATQQ